MKDNKMGQLNDRVLRSQDWFGDTGKNGFIARHHLRALGLGDSTFEGRPIVGISNTYSELTPCNAHLRQVSDAVRRGVLRAGGVPLEFPSMSLGEAFIRPSSMLHRNLAAMEIEEQIRSNPLDAVVLLTGCDKTTPAAIMGATSANIPAIIFTGGPMLNGKFRGRDVGSGTGIWKMADEVRAGRATREDERELEKGLNRSAGHCMTMGTASTMACLTETLGLMLPGVASLPAVDARRLALAEETGMRAVEIAGTDLTPLKILTRESFENATRVSAAIGGSTNAILHLLAIAGRASIDFTLEDFDSLGRDIPLLVDLMPSGRFLMEEFSDAGGMPALISRMADMLHPDALTVTGKGVVANYGLTSTWDDEVIRPLDNPVLPAGLGTIVVKGTLAPNGAVLKVSAADPSLLVHEGRAVVFDSIGQYMEVADDPDLDIEADDFLIVRNSGPVGYPGMPEVGNVPIPAKLLKQGVSDMLRISDARMSGTAFGACILHVSPEAAVGGPLAVVRTGDRIRFDAHERVLDLLISEQELGERLAQWERQAPVDERGWTGLYRRHVLQAHLGADMDFLVGSTDSTELPKAF